LILTPVGMVDGTAFACGSYSANQHTCSASVLGLTAGPYNAAVQITHTVSAQSVLTPALDSAFTVTAPSGGGMCLSGTTLVAATGSGTCADAYKIDLSAEAVGSDWHFVIADTFSNDQSDASIGANHVSGECAMGTARDVVFGIRFPNATMVGTVSAEGVGVNPIVTVSSDNACAQIPLTACSNATGSDACETVNVADVGSTEYFYVVAELVDSGQEIIVSLTSL
jgi:hypothetical protein